MTTSTEETLRLTVAALMHATGESKTDLAAGTGLTQPKVSRRQLGQTSWTLADCDALAAHYGMNVLQLLAGPTVACESLPPERRRSSNTSQPPNRPQTRPPPQHRLANSKNQSHYNLNSPDHAFCVASPPQNKSKDSPSTWTKQNALALPQAPPPHSLKSPRPNARDIAAHSPNGLVTRVKVSGSSCVKVSAKNVL